MALLMAQDGKDVIATDLSNDMLEIVQEKAWDQDVRLRIACMDMRDFDMDEAVDAVICLTDSINYILDPSDVQNVFHHCFKALKPKGSFVFDVNSIYKCTELEKGYEETIDDGDFHFKWSATSRDHLITHIIDIVDGDEVIHEVHQEYSLTHETYLTMLSSAGFKDVSFYSDCQSFIEACDHVIYICRKGE